jgi:hypothetical protein
MMSTPYGLPRQASNREMDLEIELEDAQTTLAALAENAASAYAVLAAVIRHQLSETAATFPQATDAQMVDALISEYGEDGLIEEILGFDI